VATGLPPLLAGTIGPFRRGPTDGRLVVRTRGAIAMNATVKDIMTTPVAAVRHVEGVVAVRDRLSYPRDAREAPVVGPLF
jgi:hypothetical protein